MTALMLVDRQQIGLCSVDCVQYAVLASVLISVCSRVNFNTSLSSFCVPLVFSVVRDLIEWFVHAERRDCGESSVSEDPGN